MLVSIAPDPAPIFSTTSSPEEEPSVIETTIFFAETLNSWDKIQDAMKNSKKPEVNDQNYQLNIPMLIVNIQKTQKQIDAEH